MKKDFLPNETLFSPERNYSDYLVKILLFVNNILRTRLDFVEQDTDILPQHTDRQQLNTTEKDNGSHN